MMQPPRQICAISPKFSFQLYSFCAVAHELEALRVAADLGAVEGVVDRGEQRLLGAAVFLRGALQDLRGGDALVLDGRDAAGKDRLGDRRRGDAHVERVGRGPLARAFLPGGVEDDVDEGLLRDRVLLLQDVGGDLDQEAVEDAVVPLARRSRSSRPA